MPRSFRLYPIGVIENEFTESVPRGWEAVLHRLVFASDWVPSLEGIEQFSHLIVLFWLDRIRPPIASSVHPEDHLELPEVGIFATRTPRRPNPIGLQVTELVKREGNVLTVRGLDALNGTPLLDVKPYLPDGDSRPAAVVAEWVSQLREGAQRQA
jgi:tRNA-Thr(GGU) m(6)t(6)A37 methyltransferase TsaA